MLDINALFGIRLIAFAVAGSVGPSVAGVGFDTFDTFTPPFVGSGVIGVLGSGTVFAADRLAR